jgi:hypothetical protein
MKNDGSGFPHLPRACHNNSAFHFRAFQNRVLNMTFNIYNQNLFFEIL